MARYIVKRLLAMIPVLIGVSLLIFFLLYIAPGDPATIALGDSATPEQILEWRTEQGLEDPFFVQYGKYMWGILTRFDFGKSYRSGRPVTDSLLSAFPITLVLALPVTLISMLIGCCLGSFRQITAIPWLTQLRASSACWAFRFRASGCR